MVTSLYGAQLMPENEVTDAEWAAWEKYGTTPFLVVSEPYSSQMYLAPTLALGAERNETGYMAGIAIQSDTYAVPTYVVPGVGSRDYQPLVLSESNGNAYLTASDYLAIYADDVPDVWNGDAICTIQPDGYARWYKTGAAAGRTLTVERPDESCCFYIYDAEGAIVALSIFGDTEAVLPEDGYLLFAGDAGDRFDLFMR
jgi:hypothetical protein